MLFLGIDIGSSSVKLVVLEGETGKCTAAVQHPQTEFEISSPKQGWAEQHPDLWWQSVVTGCEALASQVDMRAIDAIGIAYQMHGLVLVDRQHQPLRPAIIWCDSRAVELGNAALETLGADYCFRKLLNSPGNFTASKLRWVQENEPAVFDKTHSAMLPGDYIALKLSGELSTTRSGLSEGTFWDFEKREIAGQLLEHWNIDTDLLPALVPNLGEQVTLSGQAATLLGLRPGVPVTYRAGDQPNNAFSLNVLEPGELAATAGTSGVIYGVTDRNCFDERSRVNTFLHVNDESPHSARNGVLLCLNGAGRSYAWLRQTLAQAGASPGYERLNQFVSKSAVGSDGLLFYPFGNGAERLLGNRNPGASFTGLDFNRHGIEQIVRATQEGVVFAMNYGVDVLEKLGLQCSVVRAGQANLFLSQTFAEAFANTTGAVLELYDTNGAEGAARGAALGSGFYPSPEAAFAGLDCKQRIEPTGDLQQRYCEAYEYWKENLAGS